jgi:predicted phosphodiesterase
VFIHHNPGLTGNFGVIDTAALYEVIRPRKQVKAYIFGHTHHWETTQDSSGIHLVNLPPVAYVFKDGEPSGWVRANLGTDHMRLELRCIDEKHPMHAKVVKLDWR